MTERLLFEAFRAQRSAEAFDQLYERYATIVYSTAMRILNDRTAAEDAVQATFLVFARRAADLPQNTVLAGWFYLTARRCALGLRRSATRRAIHERRAAQMSGSSDSSGLWNEVRPELDNAIAGLPAEQREALILHYFQGLSVPEAAQVLGCPRETLHTRITRGLGRLRERLGHRGAAATPLVLAALLGQRAIYAAPPELAPAIKAACAGKTAASATAVATANAVCKAMVLAKTKAMLLMMAGVLTVSAPVAYLGIQAVRSAATSPPAAQQKAASSQKTGTSPAVPAGDAAQVAPPPSSKSLASFDFEDGRTLPEWRGTIVSNPHRNGHCLSAEYIAELRLWRAQIGDNANGLFSYPKGAVLSFDYWSETNDELKLFMWSRTQSVSMGQHLVRNPAMRKWTHELVDLSKLENGGQHLLDGSLIVDITIQTGEGGGAFYIDNLKVDVPQIGR